MGAMRTGLGQEWYTTGWVSNDSGMQKDRFQTRLVHKRIGFRRVGYTKGYLLDASGIQKDRF